MQVKFIENGRMRKRRILIGTSLDFEIGVFSLCTLSIKDKEALKVVLLKFNNQMLVKGFN